MSLFEKLFNIRKSVEYLQKTESGNQGAKYVDPAVLVKKIRDLMDIEKVLLIPGFVYGEGCGVSVVDAPTKNNKDAKAFVIKHNFKYTWVDAEGGEREEVSWFITGKHATDPAMAEGSALTYNERYFLLKFFQIPTSKDDPEYFESKTGEKITEEQLINLREIVESRGYPQKGKPNIDIILTAYATKQCSIPSIEDLPQSRLDAAKKFLSEIAEYQGKNNATAK